MTAHRDAVPVAVLVAIGVGTAIGSLLVMSSEDATRRDVASVIGAVGVGVLASAPVSLPFGFLGGVLAAAALRRAPAGWARASWIGAGVLTGATLGGIGSGLYAAAFAGPDASMIAGFLGIGAIAGSVSGSIVGAWCAHARSSLELREASL